MQELDDSALLREYVEHGSEEAFSTLVTRHIDRVYSVALRCTGNPSQAEEITQAVFVILARKSRNLGRGVFLYSWQPAAGQKSRKRKAETFNKPLRLLTAFP